MEQMKALNTLESSLREAVIPLFENNSDDHAPPDQSLPPLAHEQALQASSKHLEDIATKFTIGYRGPPEKPEECVPLAEMLQKSAATLAGHALCAMARSCSPLRKRIRELMAGVFSATLDLVKWFKNQKTETRNVAPLLAVVWEYCKVISQLHLDDNLSLLGLQHAAKASSRLALKAAANEMNIWTTPIKDAIEELENIEVIEESTSKSKEDNEDDDNDDDELDEFEEEQDEEEGLTEKELEVRPTILTLCKIALMVLKKSSELLSICKNTLPLSQIDELVRLSKLLSEFVDDTICSIYRPQNREIIRQNATRLCDAESRLAVLSSEILITPSNDPQSNVKTLNLLISKASATLSSLPT